jgi:beta-aspartyl-dipeptidase (metallo-type)
VTPRLTASSDASIKSPRSLFEQVRSCVLENGFSLEETLPLVTANTSALLKLVRKGRLAAGNDADALVLRKDTLEIRDVIAQGRCLVRQGKLTFSEDFLSESNREIKLGARL